MPRRPLKTDEELIEECKKQVEDWDGLSDGDKETYIDIAAEEDEYDAYEEYPGIPCACCGIEYDEYSDDWSVQINDNGNILKICDKCGDKLIEEKELKLLNSKIITIICPNCGKIHKRKHKGRSIYNIWFKGLCT